jgi:hypothetical protein
MSNYQLNIAFDNAGLAAITQAGQSVTIVKRTRSEGETPTAAIHP